MSKEVIEIVIGMDQKNVETQLALQCAPLITGIKISNLLIVPTENDKLVSNLLRHSGLGFYRLLKTRNKVTFLLFRRSALEKYLSAREVQSFFGKEGYADFRLGSILRKFQERYEFFMKEKQDFPHEMGLLLGYPLEDVVGFIRNSGEHYLYSGYWKVYSDVETKKAIFEKYEDAKEELVQLLSAGLSMEEILFAYKEINSNEEVC